jgi:hypothetical protein
MAGWGNTRRQVGSVCLSREKRDPLVSGRLVYSGNDAGTTTVPAIPDRMRGRNFINPSLENIAWLLNVLCRLSNLMRLQKM